MSLNDRGGGEMLSLSLSPVGGVVSIIETS